MGSSNSKSSGRNEVTPIWRIMEGWNDHQMVIRIQGPDLDRLVLINKLVLIMRPAAWDENYDIWIMPTAAAERTYPELAEKLHTPPNTVIDFSTNQESVRGAKVQKVNRWHAVAKLLTMPVPWTGYRLPYGQYNYENAREIGYLYKGIFNKENRAWCHRRQLDFTVRVEDCFMSVWHRFHDSQHVDHFVRAAAGEPWRYT